MWTAGFCHHQTRKEDWLLADAYQALSIAFIEVTELKNKVLPGAQSAFDAAGRGYREGKFDYLTVLDAQRTFFHSRARYIESLACFSIVFGTTWPAFIE